MADAGGDFESTRSKDPLESESAGGAQQQHVSQNGNVALEGAFSEDEEGDYEEDSDELFDDSDSLLNDIMEADEGTGDIQISTDICTPEQSRAFKSRLREVGPDKFIEETITAGVITAKKLCTAFGIRVPMLDGRPDSGYYRILGIAIMRELNSRQKLTQYNTIDDAVSLLEKSNNILVITGAGISTNLGVPDFRSKDTGFYAKMADRFDDPQEIFDIHIFDEDPSIFFENSAETLPAPGKTSPTHAFIKLLDTKEKLLTNYTQNIDNVEGNAGISQTKLIQCHGSWATFTCRKCGYTAPGANFYEAVKNKTVPKCPECIRTLESKSTERPGMKRKRSSNSTNTTKSRRRPDEDDDDSADDGRYDIPEPGVMKPNITFFGEQLPDAFFERFIQHDRHKVDLVIVIGTSMTVAPVADIPQACDPDVPVIYISRDPVRHFNFDIVLLGDCDVVVAELCRRAGWEFVHHMLPADREVEVEQPDEDSSWIWRVKAKTKLPAPTDPLAAKPDDVKPPPAS